MNVIQMTDETFFTVIAGPIGTVSNTGRAENYMTPPEVVGSRSLTNDEKREILASWVSDRWAVPNIPSLRRLDNGMLVHVDEVLGALRALDAGDCAAEMAPWLDQEPRGCMTGRSTRLPSSRQLDGSDDDDDDPPPCPAMMGRPWTGPLSSGEAVDPGLAMAA